MDLMKSLKIAASGLGAQSHRMRIISENIANTDSISNIKGGDPYQRKLSTFKQVYDNEIGAELVQHGKVKFDTSDFGMRLEPGHPGADDKGYVKTPNVNGMVEAMDMREAQRSYEANLNVITSARKMLSKTLDILRV